MKKWLAAIFVLAGLVLVACGGGGGGLGNLASGGNGGVGSGGTGISAGSVGYVAGFGSIYVNGTRYDISGVSPTLLDDTELRLGMSVKVTGTVSADFSTGVASSVESEVDARGQVSNLNVSAGSMQVQGLNITTDPETVYDGVAGLGSLANGDWVKVYGQVSGSDPLRASRIEKLSSAPSGLVISGAISQLDKTHQQFTLGNLTINYASAAFTGAIDANSISNGMVVRVRSSTAPVAGVLTASSIKLWYPLTLVEGAPLSVDGVIGAYAAPNSFKVLGYSVDASSATVSGGTASTLANGVKVEVTGLVHSGILVASSVVIRQVPGVAGPARYTATGPIVQFVSASSFKVQGQAIDASGSVTYSGGTQAQLANQVKVTVVGSHVVNGVLIADTVTFNP
jgi:hypothetical protein